MYNNFSHLLSLAWNFWNCWLCLTTRMLNLWTYWAIYAIQLFSIILETWPHRAAIAAKKFSLRQYKSHNKSKSNPNLTLLKAIFHISVFEVWQFNSCSSSYCGSAPHFKMINRNTANSCLILSNCQGGGKDTQEARFLWTDFLVVE